MSDKKKLPESEKTGTILSHIFQQPVTVKENVDGEEGIHIYLTTANRILENQTGDFIIAPVEGKFILMIYVETPQTQHEPACGDYEEFKGTAWALSHRSMKQQPVPETVLFADVQEAVLSLVALIVQQRTSDAYMVIEEREQDMFFEDTKK